MKSTLILAAAAVALAQDGGYFAGEPSCAIPCLTSAISKAGCPLSDIACQCGPTKAVIGSNVAGCLISACNFSELAQAQTAGEAICSSLSAGDISSTAAPTGTAAESSSVSITSPPSTTESTSASLTSSSVSVHSSDTLTGSLSKTATLTATVVVPSSSASLSATSNAAATPVAAKIAGGILAGAVGLIAAL